MSGVYRSGDVVEFDFSPSARSEPTGHRPGLVVNRFGPPSIHERSPVTQGPAMPYRIQIDESLFDGAMRLICDNEYPMLSREEMNDVLSELADAVVDGSGDALDIPSKTALIYASGLCLAALSLCQSDDAPGDYMAHRFVSALAALLSSIYESTSVIVSLLQEGHYHQAIVLVRNVLELCSTLLGISLDRTCREKYLNNDRLSLRKGEWNKYFSFKAVERILAQYEGKIEGIEHFRLGERRAQLYGRYSSFAHNSFVEVTGSHHLPARSFLYDDEPIDFCPFGSYRPALTRSRADELCDVLFYVTRVFRFAVIDETVEGVSKEMFSQGNYAPWNAGISLLFFADGCYLCNRAIEDGVRLVSKKRRGPDT